MSSNERSHSAVRNLRSLFENKASADTTTESPDTRGRSPIGPRAHRDSASGRPISKVRASFVAVEPPKMAVPSAGHDMSVADMGRASSIQARRGSFSMDNKDPLSIADLKQGVTDERVRRESRPDLGTPMPEDALASAETSPVVEPKEDQAMGTVNHAASKLSEMTVAPGNENEPPAAPESEPPMNPDKPNTGAEEEEGEMKPAEAVNEAAVSGGEALPPPTEDLTQQNVDSEAHGLDAGKTNGTSETTAAPKKSEPAASTEPESVPGAESTTVPESTPAPEPTPKTKPTPKTAAPTQKRGSMAPQTSISKPSSISANRTKKDPPTTDPKSPTSPPSTATKSPTSKPVKEPVRKPSRTSLAAPTAASKARTSSSEKRASSAKPRESTKPSDVSSRLLAPTAASRARHEAEQAAPAKPTTSTNRQTSKPPASKPQISSSKPAPRPASRSSHTSASAPKKATSDGPAGGSFLDRMMRPTAASAQKVHEKTTESKSPPRKTAAPAAKKPSTNVPKTNGTAKPAAKAEKPLSKAALENAAEKTEEGKQEHERDGGEVPTEAPEDAGKEIEEIAEQKGGSETPVGESGRDEQSAAKLEGTPAFGEEGIR